MKLRRRRGGWLPKGLPDLSDRDDLRPGLIVAGVVVAAFVAGWLVAAQLLFPPTSEAEDAPLVEVPSLADASLDEARGRLEEGGLSAEISFRLTPPGADSGRVLAQRPLAGQMAPRGSAVHLTVSGSPGEIRIPGLTGLPEERARSVVEAMGLAVATRQEPSAVRQGEVVATEPPAGTRVRPPDTLVLVMSEGPEVVRVPEVVGRHVDDVVPLLREAGLELGAVDFDPDAAAAPGRVVGQSPPPDFALRRGGEVSIRVAGSRDDWSRPPAQDTGGTGPAASEGTDPLPGRGGDGS